MQTLYTTSALVTGDGRNGHGRTSDGLLDVDLAAPRDMGGNGLGTNPEQLFATGYAACFHEAIRLTGRQQRADVSGSSVEAVVALGQDPDGSYALAVELHACLPGLDQHVARRLVDVAHQTCPYSRAIRDNVDVALVVKGRGE